MTGGVRQTRYLAERCLPVDAGSQLFCRAGRAIAAQCRQRVRPFFRWSLVWSLPGVILLQFRAGTTNFRERVKNKSVYEQVKNYALGLPEATEKPHFKLTSFRVRDKIFATAPRDGRSINIFVDETDRDRALALNPAACEKLWWGSSVVGLKVHLHGADAALVKELLRLSWLRKAPKSLHKRISE